MRTRSKIQDQSTTTESILLGLPPPPPAESPKKIRKASANRKRTVRVQNDDCDRSMVETIQNNLNDENDSKDKKVLNSATSKDENKNDENQVDKDTINDESKSSNSSHFNTKASSNQDRMNTEEQSLSKLKSNSGTLKKKMLELASKASFSSKVSTVTPKSIHEKNPLSDVIPGYIAPLSLDSTSLNKYKQPLTHKFCNTTDAVVSSIPKSSTTTNTISSPSSTTTNLKTGISSSKNSRKNQIITNAGSQWFNMEATPMSDSLKADIAIIQNRTYLDPKRFYKSSDFQKKNMNNHKILQLGKVIEGSMESIHSNRLTKKEQKGSILEEVMGDVFSSKDDYVKKKYTNMQREKSALGKRMNSANHHWKNSKRSKSGVGGGKKKR